MIMEEKEFKYIPVKKEVKEKLVEVGLCLKGIYKSNFTYSQVIDKALDLLIKKEKNKCKKKKQMLKKQ